MAKYKITGTVNDTCYVYIVQDNAYQGKIQVTPSSYEIIFESASASPVTAMAENDQGMIVGFGSVTPLDATGEETNLIVPDTPASIPATYQTTSFTTYDDGYYESGNAKDYVDNGDGTVTDNASGLMWVKDGTGAGCNNGTYTTWYNALTFARNSTFAGYDDWRIPNFKELFSLLDFSTFPYSIDSVALPNTVATLNWTSTSYYEGGGSPNQAWVIHFAATSIGYTTKASSFPFRPVRGGM